MSNDNKSKDPLIAKKTLRHNFGHTAVSYCSFLSVFGVRVSVMFQLIFVHYFIITFWFGLGC